MASPPSPSDSELPSLGGDDADRRASTGRAPPKSLLIREESFAGFGDSGDDVAVASAPHDGVEDSLAENTSQQAVTLPSASASRALSVFSQLHSSATAPAQPPEEAVSSERGSPLDDEFTKTAWGSVPCVSRTKLQIGDDCNMYEAVISPNGTYIATVHVGPAANDGVESCIVSLWKTVPGSPVESKELLPRPLPNSFVGHVVFTQQRPPRRHLLGRIRFQGQDRYIVHLERSRCRSSAQAKL